ncbi:hypothetical protein [Flavobacterium sp.]|jgi:hypothetical protein|uniref:hypothetical protein n=1 Tax=Flavobacterium sp. TaxID=239 RepID=UPI0037BE8B94
MATKFIKFTGLFLLLTTLTGCPGSNEDCFDYGSTARVDDLVSITPFQSTYNIGDTITYKVIIPSSNTFFGAPINLFEITNDNNARIHINPIIFNDNQVTYLKGSVEAYEGGWSNVSYNNENGNYELEINIKLLKGGLYSFLSGEYLIFQGSSECNRYRLDTNIEGWDIDNDGRIEFIVQ